MCGRFDLHTPRDSIAETWFGIMKPVGNVRASYNTAPGQFITIIIHGEEHAGFRFANWGYKPDNFFLG